MASVNYELDIDVRHYSLVYGARTAQLGAIGPVLVAANGESSLAQVLVLLVEEDLGSIPAFVMKM